jgi:hypothetical protein
MGAEAYGETWNRANSCYVSNLHIGRAHCHWRLRDAGSLLVRTPPPNADEALVWRGHVEARPTGVSQTLATHLVDVIDGYRGMVGELLTLARWAGVLIALLGLAQLSMLVHRGPEGGTIAAKAQSDSPPERSGTNAQAI